MAEFYDFKIVDVSFQDKSIDIDAVEIEDKDVLEYVVDSFEIEEVFPVNELEEWAKNNGYIKEQT